MALFSTLAVLPLIRKIVIKAMYYFFGTTILAVIIFKYVPIPITPLMVIRCFENIYDGKTVEFQHDWEPLENISINLQKAAIAGEDSDFLQHYGFDFNAMFKAFKHNQNGRKIRGGSTITQQTAKNVFLWHGRSYVRKILEAYFTILIEFIWGKERIMEVYLNSIEMGNGIYGAKAACKYWYHLNEAHNLTRIQAAGLIAILPSPRKYKAVNSTKYINRRKRIIAKYIAHVPVLSY